MKNIRVNPKVCLTVDVRDPVNPFENQGVMVQGKAIIEKTFNSSLTGLDKRTKTIYKDFNKKYPVLSEVQSSTQVKYQEFREVLVKVRANRMVYWKGHYFITVNFDPKSGTPKKITTV